MKINLLVLGLFLSLAVNAGEYASQAEENPFLNGQLNSVYEGELTGLGGTVLEIREIENKPLLYLLDLKIDNVKAIWVSSIAQVQGKEIKIGDEVIFKGYISRSKNLDETGVLIEKIKSSTLLLAIYAVNTSL